MGVNIRVVNNHVVVLNSSTLVFLCDLAEGIEEKTIAKLHDVRLVNARDFLYTRITTGHPVRRPMTTLHER